MHSPTHLTNFLSCNYLSTLERAAKQNLLTRPHFNDPIAELLKKQGEQHEKSRLDFLKTQYKNVVELSRGNPAEQAEKTITAMKAGADVIYQGALTNGEWYGYSDFLIKVNTPSKLGNYSYIVEDTKLSAEVKGEAILQLCIYAELVSLIQGRLPDEIAIIGGTNERFFYNPSDFFAYLQYAKKKYLQSTERDLEKALNELPQPVERCHICNWRGHCEKFWHDHDHLKLVAGTSRLQRKELTEQAIDTLTKLAKLPLPPRLNRSSSESTEKIHKQAKVQLEGRQRKTPVYEFIEPIIEQQGLSGLPEPSPGDIWFDIEGDVHIGEQGLEYLFGWVVNDGNNPVYHAAWAKNYKEERDAIERFIRLVLKQRKQFPGMHVYHYGHYEEVVVKRLSTRYNLLVDEVDDLLRHDVFINLLRVVKNGLRLSVEGYGLKEIETHYDFTRNTDLTLAGRARNSITLYLDTGTVLDEQVMQTVQDYNEDDCRSTLLLHQWLEKRRDELIASGKPVPRFVKAPEADKKNPKLEELALLSERLYKLFPDDFQKLTPQQQAIKSLADLLLWYRREDKSYWWEHFRMKELTPDELMEERKGLGGPFEYVGIVGQEKKSVIHRWKFPLQVFEGRDDLNFCNEDRPKIQDYEVDTANQFLDVVVGPKSQWRIDAITKATGFFSSKRIGTAEQIERLKELAEYVLANGMEGDGDFITSRNLLLRKQILSNNNASLRQKRESVLECAKRLTKNLTAGVILPIQGPPGTGKTYTAAHMICELIHSGKTVGVTAQSHAVVLNLMTKVHEVNEKEYHLKIEMLKQRKEDEDLGSIAYSVKVMESADIEREGRFHLIGATTWVWARRGMIDKVDVLFIDEAGQFALADAVAASHSAASLVMLGDPQQLENVTQGVHPPEIEVSVLGYWLGDRKVIGGDQGLFLENTFRMAPGVNAFISETFYEGKLHTTSGLEAQKIISNSALNGSGLQFISCEHEGNQSSSMEEVALIKQLVETVLEDGKWVNKDGIQAKLTKDDILIVAPYNAQVNMLKAALPNLRIGTVDKFQGRQARIVIYSMATSSPEEAPRGMEFLYSLNRLNVAVSRAQCLAVIVASPALFELSCKTPHQMKLANAFCRFLEMAE